jgi:hypothetical protein
MFGKYNDSLGLRGTTTVPVILQITALDAVVQSRESSDIYKVVDAPGPGDAQVPRTHQTFTLSYDQCLDAAEKRAAEIKELHDILQEFAHSLKTS